MGEEEEDDLARAETLAVEDSCGCVWCDLGLEPTRPFTDALVHKTARGTFRCTNPNRK